MYDLQAVTEVISRGAELYRHYAPPEWNVYPNAAAVCALLAGFAMAFWGARLLRTIYVLGFLGGGALAGLKVGRYLQIDPLIGLTFGGGLAAFLGYFFYRWWVGMTAGLLAVVLVLAVAWPRIQDADLAYRDRLSGVGTGEYTLGIQPEVLNGAYLSGLVSYMVQDRKELGGRLVAAAGLACLLGLLMGLLLPRLTVALGTSLFGVLLLLAGAGVLLYRHTSELWSRLSAHPDWYLLAAACVLAAALWKQLRPARVKVPTAPAPAGPPPATATK